MTQPGGIVHVRLESSEFSADGLQIARLEGVEALCELFSFELDLSQVATDLLDAVVDLATTSAAMLGSTATLVFERDGLPVRRIHGLITAVDEAIDPRVDKAAEAGALRVRFMPRAFRLSLVEMHEVFLAKSIPEIIKDKLARIGLEGDDVAFRLAGNYPAREFVVQYKETDLAFITRLCERYGITFRFEHDAVDRIVFVDMQSAFDVVAPHALTSGEGDEIIVNLRSSSRLVPATRAVSDFNPVLPQLNLQEHVDVEGGDFGGVIDLVTKYKTADQGTPLAGIRAEQTECHRVLLRGSSGAPVFTAGAIVPLSDAPTLTDPSMLLTRVKHRITQQAGLLGTQAAEPYENDFEAVRGSVQYRPLHATPTPRVYGVVTGFIEEFLASGKYAVLDDRGRYWVRFEFDAAPHPDKHSLPIRMMQPHAGPSYGMHLPLKRGTEVMVSFLDGDVDRPVIVGSVPNELTQSPVNQSNHQINKLLKTETGIVIEARDVWEPEAPHYQQKPGS